ncbi:cytidylyltransferase domain-containing protein [Methanobrevibacter sp.]|uniref:cytidylyltransferase domain-containing protein n=1 Tax=Methanobrevibacter sp. TaxID=66852 RepID=UPI00386A3333
MKIGAIIQARTSSSRLPRKVLKPLPFDSGICVLQQVIRRVSKSQLIDEVIVATSNHEEDQEIVDVAKKENINYYCGSLSNVLQRYYNAAKQNYLDVIVRITSDCPCMDSNIIDKIVQNHLDLGADYTSNSLTESFPRGIDVEVINFDVLERAYLEASHGYEKEHVTPFIYKSHPNEFKINNYVNDDDNSNIRITLDTPQDYSLLCCVYDNLYENNNFFTLDDILELFDKKPWIMAINEDIIQKKVCSTLSEELEEAINLCDVQDLNKAKEFIENHFGV